MLKEKEYYKLYSNLRRQIIEGEYKEGDLLPSESDLKTLHKLSQPTVRKAVELLQNEGLVTKRQGKGSIVKHKVVGVGVASFENNEEFTSQTDNQKIQTVIVKKPDLLSELPNSFGFSAATSESRNGYFAFERKRKIEEEVIFHEAICLPNIDLAQFRQIKLEGKSFYETLFTKYEIITTSSQQKFWAMQADEELAQQLNVAIGSPILRLQRKFSTNRSDFHIYSNLFAHTEKVYLFNTSN